MSHSIFQRVCKTFAVASLLGATSLAMTGCESLSALTHSQNSPSASHSMHNMTKGKTMIDHKSPYDFATTSARLKTVIENSPANLFAVIPHSEGAKKAGMSLNPTTLFIFGNPKVGTPVLQANQRMAMELPVKLLVWQDDKGDVFVSQQDFEALASEYNLTAEQVAPLNKAVTMMVNKALADSK